MVINEGLISDFPIVAIVLTGQSPVRIRGPVSKGDYIYPSRTKPGVAIAIKPKDAEAYERQDHLINRLLGVALESSQALLPEFDSNQPEQEYLIRCKIN